jgi:eukaryotic-like serine/threonine-protein kinase
MAGSEIGYWKRFEGCVIGSKYTLFDLIGVGGSAGVFDAEHRIGSKARRTVAIKLIEAIRGAEQEQEEELITSLELSHPNVLRCHDAGRVTLLQTELLYLVMERATANLNVYMRSQTLTPKEHEEYREIFRQIAQGLHYLHTHPSHYVHRDIKPGNVLRVGDAWKLADFGIMQQLRGLTTVMTIQNPGTFPFMSPEANDGKTSSAWDVWSLGVLMVHGLTGEYPFRQTQEKTLVQSIREDEPYFATPIPAQFEAVIRGCLTKDYRTRWTAAQVVEALTAIATTPQFPPAIMSTSASIPSVPRSQVTAPVATPANRPTQNQPPPIPAQLNGMELVHIPAGEFMMGSSDRDNETPPHRVYLDDYYITRTPVTVQQFKQFCTELGRMLPLAPPFNPSWSKDDHPIVNLSWFGATAYCEWLSRKPGIVVNLPTEAQWEKAVHGTDGRTYPWGAPWDASRLHCSKRRAGDAGGTADVGCFPSGASPYGMLDMAGNVWEWCQDWYDANYYKTAPPRNPMGPFYSPQGFRVLRGGAWDINNPINFRCAYRHSYAPLNWYHNVGFRCVVRADIALRP